MKPIVSDIGDASQVADFAASLVEQFGPRAFAIAEGQAKNSCDGVAASWRAIAACISSNALIATGAPNPPRDDELVK